MHSQTLPRPALAPVALAPWPTAPTAQAEPVHLVAQWAIRLPSGAWWRDETDRAADPEGTDPTVYPSRTAAEAARAALVKIVCGPYGAHRRNYRPRILRRAVSAPAAGHTPAALSAWQDAPEAVTR
ncbi:hypothetical protein [Nocardia sp. CC201C]|uniref:hypothetical protein n=1 Tax=Nocardia sp. CC201C TaxID=3044575 RepID=UPI0024A87769|nr:hypothetical protein [Nocardia sp. CC201C]